jgi:hypothetical protein
VPRSRSADIPAENRNLSFSAEDIPAEHGDLTFSAEE